MTATNRILQIAAKQGGIVRLNQIVDCGIAAVTARRRAAVGEWTRLGRGVYRIIDMEDHIDRVKAAVAVLPNAVASHDTAALLHSVGRVRTDRATVTVHSRTTHTFPGVVVRRTQDLAEDHVIRVKGIAVTTIARTVVDLAADLNLSHLEDVVDDLLRDRRIQLEEVDTLARAIARRGKPGSARLRAVIEGRMESAAPTATRLELRGLGIIETAGLPRPTIQYSPLWNPHIRFDAAYPEHRIAIEWDSRRWHSDPGAFQSDRSRDRIAQLYGWRIFRFTWQDVVDHPAEVVTTIRRALKGIVPRPD